MDWTVSSGFIIVCLVIKSRYAFITKNLKSLAEYNNRELAQGPCCVPRPCVLYLPGLVIPPQDKEGQRWNILGAGGGYILGVTVDPGFYGF